MPDTKTPDTVEQIAAEIEERYDLNMEVYRSHIDNYYFVLRGVRLNGTAFVNINIQGQEPYLSTSLTAEAAREFARAHLKPLNDDDMLKEAEEIMRIAYNNCCTTEFWRPKAAAFLARVKERP